MAIIATPSPSSTISSVSFHFLKPNSLPNLNRNLNFKRRPSPSTTSRTITSTMAVAVATTATKVVPSIIIGGGRVGTALQGMGDGEDVLVKRGESVPVDFPGPIFVCTRNDDLDAILESTPRSRWRDMVFFQNGMLDPWLESKGLSDADQVLAYFAVSKLGEQPVDGVTDTNPEGLTAAFGKWGTAVATRLQAGGLSCKVLEKEPFQKQMLEKLIWISAFMLVGARHPGATVGVVEREYHLEVVSLIAELASAAAAEKGVVFEDRIEERLCAYARAVSHFPTAVKEVLEKEPFQKQMLEKLIWISAFMLVGARHPGATVGVVEREYHLEVVSLIAELASAAAAEKGVVFEDRIEERLCAYARAVSHFPTAVKEFKWRNGWFYWLSEKAIAQGKPDPCPLHTTWLKELKIVQ